MATKFTGSDTGKAGLEVKKTTGTPDVKGVTKIQLDTNLTLTDNGNGGVTIQSSGGGGSGTVTAIGGGDYVLPTPEPLINSGTITLFVRGGATIAPSPGGNVEGFNAPPPDDTGYAGQGWLKIPSDPALTGDANIYIPYWIGA